MFVDVSARNGTGIQELVDAVLLTADAGLDLSANRNMAARGVAIESLRRFKDDVTEVRTDYEAGIGLGKYNDIQIGDEIETTELVEKPRG